MTNIEVRLGNFVTGGPYSYTIKKDNVGYKTVTGLANIAAAWNSIRDDLVAVAGTETVQSVVINIQSS